MTLDELLTTRRDEILAAAARHGARNVRIFGPVARKQARPGSDIDVLVDLDADRSLLDHAALLVELEDLLGCPVGVVTERGLRDDIRAEVLAEAVPLWE